MEMVMTKTKCMGNSTRSAEIANQNWRKKHWHRSQDMNNKGHSVLSNMRMTRLTQKNNCTRNHAVTWYTLYHRSPDKDIYYTSRCLVILFVHGVLITVTRLYYKNNCAFRCSACGLQHLIQILAWLVKKKKINNGFACSCLTPIHSCELDVW